MVSMLRGVTSGGGTAGWASAAGHQLAGKTGTVNNHTDVWFIGFTPTYVTGVWMGNPNKKTSLGGGMTGSAGALPIFNAFMNEFMKDKDKDSFPPPPPMPPDIQRKNLSKRPEEPEETSEEESDVQTANEGSPDLLPRLSREVPVIAPTPQPLN